MSPLERKIIITVGAFLIALVCAAAFELLLITYWPTK